ncbi:MAG: recombinase RecA, partial [Trueperaceae bacterium]|nr:recombinase RecA [Trueperaceae bacterium]
MSHQRQESLDATIMQIEKQFGKGAIMRLGDE